MCLIRNLIIAKRKNGKYIYHSVIYCLSYTVFFRPWFSTYNITLIWYRHFLWKKALTFQNLVWLFEWLKPNKWLNIDYFMWTILYWQINRANCVYMDYERNFREQLEILSWGSQFFHFLKTYGKYCNHF